MFLLWKVVDYFQPRSFLEIGFAAGQTMGIIYEASSGQGSYVSVDKNYQKRHIFVDIFPEARVLFNEVDSRYVEFDHAQQFDFVHIDGNHNYEMVVNDIRKCLPLIHEKTILCMDDYFLSGVDQAIRDVILAETDFRPFLFGDQTMLFHHCSQSKDTFLDIAIQEKSRNFVQYANEEIYGATVLKAQAPNVFMDHPRIFVEVLKTYDL